MKHLSDFSRLRLSPVFTCFPVVSIIHLFYYNLF